MQLRALGWRDTWSGALGEGLVPARVSAVHSGAVDVLGTPELSRALLAPDTPPITVGDWVGLELTDPARVRALLPRSSALMRQSAGRATAGQLLAANVDLCFLVTAVGADFSERRIERYLALAFAGGTLPVVVVNKIDREPASVGRWTRQAEAVAPGVQVIATTTLWEGGLAELEELLAPGRTIALLGSSGVGKSSIVNALRHTDASATAPVRASDDTGRHTTTRRELHLLPGERGLLIDTPGLRELALWEADGLDQAFADLTELAAHCHYRDCTHTEERDCAVSAAVERGEFAAERLASWQALQREVAARELMRDPRARKAEGRRFGKRLREVSEERKRRGR